MSVYSFQLYLNNETGMIIIAETPDPTTAGILMNLSEHTNCTFLRSMNSFDNSLKFIKENNFFIEDYYSESYFDSLEKLYLKL